MKKKFVPLKNKLSWRTVFTAGFYVSLIVALKRIKGRKLELKNPLRFSSCVVCYYIKTSHRERNVDKSNHFPVVFPFELCACFATLQVKVICCIRHAVNAKRHKYPQVGKKSRYHNILIKIILSALKISISRDKRTSLRIYIDLSNYEKIYENQEWHLNPFQHQKSLRGYLQKQYTISFKNEVLESSRLG